MTNGTTTSDDKSIADAVAEFRDQLRSFLARQRYGEVSATVRIQDGRVVMVTVDESRTKKLS